MNLVQKLGQVISGLDAWVLLEAADYDKPEYVNITNQQLNYMLRAVKREQ